MTTAEPAAAERTAVPSAVAEIDTMHHPSLAIVEPVPGEGSTRYTAVRLYMGPATDSYYAYPMRVKWFLTRDEAASMARTLRAVADAIEADADARIEAGA